jgi:SET domain-containing protein
MDYYAELMYIQTMRDIQPDEELTINYNGPWDSSDPVWFPTEP